MAGIGEIIALAKAFGGSGGGSSGGVLVVNLTWSEDGNTATLDKTWQEIADAAANGIVKVVENKSPDSYTPVFQYYSVLETGDLHFEISVVNPYYVSIYSVYYDEGTYTGSIDAYKLATNSPSGYPSFTYPED